MNTVIDYVSTAIRVHTVRTDPTTINTRVRRNRPTTSSAPRRALVFDCETTVDTSQRLNFGVWRIYVDDVETEPGSNCVEEGIFYANDLPARDPDGYQLLCDYARKATADVAGGCRSALILLSRTSFVDHVLYPVGYKQRATIVGFNLPFDLSRIATYAGAARGRNRGGISLRIWSHNGGEHPYRPRVVIRSIGGKRALISFASVKDNPEFNRGRFLDLSTLTFAHRDAHLTLEGATKSFGVPYIKRPVIHGAITAEYVDYCREDVQATSALYRAATREHAKHPIDLDAHRAMSAASIGKSYWRAMGITPFAERNVPPDPTIAGYGMAAFYGGRAECRIRGVETPVVYVDFKSMYVTCNALMHTWKLIIADHLTTVDVTNDVQAFLQAPDLAARCFDPTTWPMLHTLVEIEPNGAILPVRAHYNHDTWGVGVNPLHSNQRCWYALGDVAAAVLLGGPTPVVRKALRLVPGDTHLDTLRPVRLAGAIDFDPTRDDFYTALVEERQRIKTDDSLGDTERKGLDKFTKVLANATGYGILVEYTPQSEQTPVGITAHNPGEPLTIDTINPELPGPYAHPALAACDTAAARLMLALLEHEVVTSRGGSYVFCDTDSMAIVATREATTINVAGQPVNVLAWATVDEIVSSFASLNPYNPELIPGSILKIETDENFDTDSEQREIRCYALSAKRYQLTTHNNQSIKISRHGLGHLVSPTGDNAWQQQAWAYIRDPNIELEWLDIPAVSRLSVTSPETLHWFEGHNRDLNYDEQVKPANFVLAAHPDPLDHSDIQPITASDQPPTKWETWTWIDRRTGNTTLIHTSPRDGNQRPGVRVLTYRDVLNGYRQHPEAKSLDPNGGRCRGNSQGLLLRRPVHAIHPIRYIGKESNNLDNLLTGVADPTTAITEYNPSEDWVTLVIPVLQTVPTSQTAIATGVNRRTLQRAISGHNTPHPRDRATLRNYAVNIARASTNVGRTESDQVAMYKFLQLDRHAERDITAGQQAKNNATSRNRKTSK